MVGGGGGRRKSLVKGCFASKFRYLAQVWVLYLRRLIAIYLWHCLLAEGSGDCF